MYADVILPLALPGYYTYAVPATLRQDTEPGKRVVVQFGRHKMYSAIVRRLHEERPSAYEAKEILSVIDPKPLVSEQQLAFWEWMADYYMCTMGEVMAAAIPSALKLESETRVVLHPGFDGDLSALGEQERTIVEALQADTELALSDVSKLTGRRNVIPLVKQLMERKVLADREELGKDFTPDTYSFVGLNPGLGDPQMQELFGQLEKRAPRQLHLLMTFFRMQEGNRDETILKQKLLRTAGCTGAILSQLVKKDILVVTEQEAIAEAGEAEALAPLSKLNEAQAGALATIDEQSGKHDVTLLHGVTSSGKTEIYMHLIERELKRGRQVLYLLPEIALTTQIISRLKKHFGSRLLIYHSRFNERQRAGVWHRMGEDSDEGLVIVGARSAVFLPYDKLGLVIVDEEHDPSYKQVDPAPRYNGRDTAIMLAHGHGARTLLGSATPSMESYYNASGGKYGLATLATRYADIQMPEIEVVDIADATRRKKMKSFFSERMLEAMGHSLESGRQVILFQNRRGFSPYLECGNCHWVPHCVNCDVSLTLHKKRHQLVCHYCGYSISVPSRCSACQDNDLRMHGYGTERVEDEISIFFPDRKTARLDYDSTRNKASYRQILHQFEAGETDILTGTQMVTKGLDFGNVNLVGILNADNQFNFPDFRAYERSFQLMLQVSGRAGRKARRGLVIVQTWKPEHPVIEFVKENDYNGFYAYELNERQRFMYPPFCRITVIRVKHKTERLAEEKAIILARELRERLGKRVAGPVVPHVPRIRNLHQRNIIVKTERGYPSAKFRKQVHTALDFFRQDVTNRRVLVQVDVDSM